MFTGVGFRQRLFVGYLFKAPVATASAKRGAKIPVPGVDGTEEEISRRLRVFIKSNF
jgi:hypothetical protein